MHIIVRLFPSKMGPKYVALCVALLLMPFAKAERVPLFSGNRDDDGPVVQLQQGLAQGSILSTPQGREFYAFRGLPYARPPIEDLRYKAPLPGDPWDGTFDATEEGPTCLQPGTTDVIGQEDCLTMNVYTPIIPSASSTGQLPVQIFIYGGGFLYGSDVESHYGPERYMNKDLVLVLMNYRLGALGFLSTEDASASGNFGLLDQNLGLQWIQQNVAAFGGNPNNVTLVGQSAGSASVIYHILSPMSSGLFHQAIAESGSPLCPWALEEHPINYANALGSAFGCPIDDTERLVDCLREQDPEEIVRRSIGVTVHNLTAPYVPVVENSNGGLFLTEDPITLLQEGRFNRVPLIMGVNRDEGCAIYEYTKFLFHPKDDIFYNVTIPLLLTVLTDFRQNLVEVSYAIKDEYYSDINLDIQTEVDRANIDLLSDMFMKPWAVETIQLIASHGVPVYMYAFNYVGNWSYTYLTGAADVTHAIELVYLFNETDTWSTLNEKDTQFSEQFMDLWTNFFNLGNPTPSGSVEWTPTPSDETVFLNIDESLSMGRDYESDRVKFWLQDVPAIVDS